MSELRSAGTVTHGPDVGCGGLQPIIHLNVSPRIQFDSEFLQAYTVSVWFPAGSDQEVCTLNDGSSRWAGQLQLNIRAGSTSNLVHRRIQMDVHTLVTKKGQ